MAELRYAEALHAALLGAFGSAWERWGETPVDERG